MDAHALLTSQGWRGTGNSLHPTSNSIGLSKPLLVSQKQNNLGLGKKQHKTSDMWWMNAFDSSLKGLDTSQEGKVVQTVTSGGLDMVAKGGAKWVGSKGGLYASFVRGEVWSGTLTPPAESASSGSVEGKKRKRDEVEEERRARKAANRAQTGLETPKDSEADTPVPSESKEERKARRAAKNQQKEEDLTVKDVESVDSERPETKEEQRARRALKKAQKEEEVEAEDKDDAEDHPETKEERKARRAARKLLKEQSTSGSGTATPDIEHPTNESAEQCESKEERKERRRLKKLAKTSTSTPTDSSSEEPKKTKRRKD